ncbi:MAG TPA: hypothetical protein PLG57_00285 [Bacteroidia bacterium]|nr:hypothetical protein [Bacteroidia bacterium]HQK96720.1 hypothetical protein [Bacteroidia bacterium]
MKKILSLAIVVFVVFQSASAQTAFKNMKYGHVVNVSLPEYMTRTLGLNDNASFQFHNVPKDVSGFIVEDNKEELIIADMKFADAQEFYDNFAKGFLEDQPSRKFSKPDVRKVNGNTYIHSDFSYFDEEAKLDIYYYVGVIETPTTFYKLICFTSSAQKETYKPDFDKIMMSIND